MATPASFVGLSQTLTGLSAGELPATVDQLEATGAPVKLIDVYFARLHASYPAQIDELIAAWAGVMGDPDPAASLLALLAPATPAAARFRVAARQVIKVWYLSTIDDPNKPLDAKGKNSGQLGGDLGQFQLSAVWKLIGAPVQGYSNLPHGYWAEKP